MTDAAHLKPCPFCGSLGAKPDYCGGGDWYVRCRACDSDGPFAGSESAAVEAWNQRPPGAEPQAPEEPVQAVASQALPNAARVKARMQASIDWMLHGKVTAGSSMIGVDDMQQVVAWLASDTPQAPKRDSLTPAEPSTVFHNEHPRTGFEQWFANEVGRPWDQYLLQDVQHERVWMCALEASDPHGAHADLVKAARLALEWMIDADDQIHMEWGVDEYVEDTAIAALRACLPDDLKERT